MFICFFIYLFYFENCVGLRVDTILLQVKDLMKNKTVVVAISDGKLLMLKIMEKHNLIIFVNVQANIILLVFTQAALWHKW